MTTLLTNIYCIVSVLFALVMTVNTFIFDYANNDVYAKSGWEIVWTVISVVVTYTVEGFILCCVTHTVYSALVHMLFSI